MSKVWPDETSEIIESIQPFLRKWLSPEKLAMIDVDLERKNIPTKVVDDTKKRIIPLYNWMDIKWPNGDLIDGLEYDNSENNNQKNMNHLFTWDWESRIWSSREVFEEDLNKTFKEKHNFSFTWDWKSKIWSSGEIT